MNQAESIGATAIAQAQSWVARLRSPECLPEERAAFEDWLAQSPLHVEAYLDAESLHALAGALADDPWTRAAARQLRSQPVRGPKRWLPLTLAAMVAVFGVALAWRTSPWSAAGPAPVQYSAAVGEVRPLLLDDGSRLVLDTGSRIRVSLGNDERRVEVLGGRVQFDVAADAERPFRVLAGSGVIRDIGTVFQVDNRDGRVQVSLLAGGLEVQPQPGARDTVLHPGQRLDYDTRAAGVPQSLDVDAAQGWPRGQLVFKERPLEQLLAEMNRYSKVQLELGDASLRGITVSGVFAVDDQQGLLETLRQGWSLQGTAIGQDRIVLRRLHDR